MKIGRLLNALISIDIHTCTCTFITIVLFCLCYRVNLVQEVPRVPQDQWVDLALSVKPEIQDLADKLEEM